MKPLDFLIIGAQKCATTALFEHLRHHPQIAMPLEKEVPFFTSADCSEQAWQQFSRDHFGTAKQHQLRGKASPQYLCDARAPERISKLTPGVKLVAILRDPIERTWSHYRMGQRRDTEQRDFADAVLPLLEQETGESCRRLPVPDHAAGYQSEAPFYVAWSEYGRMLSAFAERFGPQQLLVLYTEDLETQPEASLDRLLEFIGLEAGFRPSSLGKVVHRGGSSKRIPQSVRAWLRERGMLYWLWQRVPQAQRGRLRFRYEQWNVRQQASPVILTEPLHQQLHAHFSADLRVLLGLPVPRPPWINRYLGSE